MTNLDRIRDNLRGWDHYMAQQLTRRQLLQQLSAAAGAAVLPMGVISGQESPIMVAGKPLERAVFSVSPDTVRITVRPVDTGAAAAPGMRFALPKGPLLGLGEGGVQLPTGPG